jgi:UDP-N-acetylglucosamine acyltransferase
VTLGDHNRIAAHAVLKRGTRMGDHNQVSEHAVLGGEPQDLKFDPQTVSYLVIGDHNVFREAVTVNRGSQPEQATVLGDHNFMMTTAHIGHDCKVGNHNIFANAIALAGHVTMEDRVFVSGGVMIHQFTQVGTLAMLGGNSKVTQDCLPYMITDGNPARVRGLNLVGLKRAGLSAAELKALKSAFRILFGGGSSLAEVKSQLGALDSSHARHLVRFIDNSRRGYHRQKGA